MYTDYQVKSITEILNKIINTRNTLSISRNTQINKLVYEIELDTCSLSLIIESIGGKIEFKYGENIIIKLNSDTISFSSEMFYFTRELEKQKELISKYFLVLTKS